MTYKVSVLNLGKVTQYEKTSKNLSRILILCLFLVLGANNFLYKQRTPLNIHKYFISQHGLLIPLDLLIHSGKNV